MAKGKGRGRYQFTTRRRGALKKAQMISARRRKGRGSGGMSSGKAFGVGAGAGAGILGLVGTAYYLGSKTTSHKNTPGGSNSSHPMGTDPNNTAGDILAPTYKEPSIDRADPQGMTTRVAKKAAAKKAAKKAASAPAAPQRKGGSTATAAAQAVEASKQAAGVVPPTRKGATPTTSTPSTVNTTTAASGTTTSGYEVKNVKNGLEILMDPQVHDQIKDWKTGVHATMKERITLELDKVNFGVSSNGVLFKKGPGSRRARKAAKTRAANASS